MRKAKPTPVAELSVVQLNAVDLLATGKSDSEAAKLLDLHRVTVTRWRLYHLEFRSALMRERAAIWGQTADRLRAILPRAVDTLANALNDPATSVSAAVALLKLAGPMSSVDKPKTAEELLSELAVVEQKSHDNRSAELYATMTGMPSKNECVATVKARLALQLETVQDVPDRAVLQNPTII